LPFVRCDRVVPLLVLFHLVSERLIPFLLFLGVFLLPLKNGRRFAAAAAACSVSCCWYAIAPPVAARAARIASRILV